MLSSLLVKLDLHPAHADRHSATERRSTGRHHPPSADLGAPPDFESYQDGQSQPGFEFPTPVTVIVRYSDQDARMVSDEGRLTLRY